MKLSIILAMIVLAGGMQDKSQSQTLEEESAVIEDPPVSQTNGSSLLDIMMELKAVTR